VADQVEAVDPEVRQDGLRRGDQGRDLPPSQIVMPALAVTRCVESQQRAPVKRRVEHEVGVVFLGRLEAVQEHQRCARALPMNGRQDQQHAKYPKCNPVAVEADQAPVLSQKVLIASQARASDTSSSA
jgi:hypothetical protein